MNSIYFDDTHRIFREQLRRFIDEQVLPYGDSWETQGEVPRQVLWEMGKLGFLGIRHPVNYGGTEMDTLGTVILAEELGRSTFGGFAVTVLVHTDMASPHLARLGTDTQLEKYLHRLISGELISAIAVTEPDAGSDVAGIKTRAVRNGDDYVLNGSKIFITNGVLADVYFVAAKTNLDVKGSRGISMFIVEKNTPGFHVSRKLEKMGWRCSDTAELAFEDCRVPAENLLGEENRGFYHIMENFQNERITLGAQSVGESTKAIELTLDYVTQRQAFGGKLFDLQTIRQRLSMLAARVEAARQLVYHTAWVDAQGKDCVKEVSMVKALCGELVNEVMYTCQQFHGGFGYIQENAIERMVRDARVQAVGGGATEVMLEEVAKRLV